MLLEKILHLYQKWDKVHQPDPTRYQVSGRPARSMLMVIQPMHLVGQSTSTTGTSLDPGVFPSGEGGLSFARRKTPCRFQVNVTSLEGRISGWWHSIFLTSSTTKPNLGRKKRAQRAGFAEKEKKKKIRFPKPEKKTPPFSRRVYPRFRWFNHPGDLLEFNGPGWKQVHTTKSRRRIISFFYVINTWESDELYTSESKYEYKNV